jgi:tetratricopeptide (TPR) repeat protein
MDYEQEEERWAQLRGIWDLRDTEDLLEIWQENDKEQWVDEVFEIIKDILLERLGEIPSHSFQLNASHRLDRADDYLNSGDLDKALRECEAAIELDPTLAEAYNYLGLVYDEKGQLDKAMASYQEAVRLDPDLEDAWENLNDVETELEEVFQDSTAKVYLDRAVEFIDNDEPERALHECDLALKLLPQLALAYNYLGLVLEELEELERAIDAYLKAVQLNPRFYAARENLANAKVKFELEQYREMAKENPDTPEPDVQYGWGESMDGESAVMDESRKFEIPYADNDIIPGMFYMDEKSFVLRGWPGNRNRPGHCGLDYLDTYAELAHIEGVVIRKLINKKFRTRNPFYLFVMSFLGLLTSSPLLLGLLSYASNTSFSIYMVIVMSPYWIAGLLLLYNVYLSLSDYATGKDNSDEKLFY